MRLRTPILIKCGLLFLCTWLAFCMRIYFMNSTAENEHDRPSEVDLDNIIIQDREDAPRGSFKKNRKRMELDGVHRAKDSAENAKLAKKPLDHGTSSLALADTGLGREALLGLILSDADADAFRENEQHDFNVFLSDRIGLDRVLPDVRPSGCAALHYPSARMTASLVVCFHNEALTALLRTVLAIVSQSPADSLEEIILVDDASDLENLGDELLSRLLDITKLARVVRLEERAGLIRARIKGAREAKGDTIIFMDSHCEVNKGWLEPLLEVVKRNRTTIACPVIDLIHSDTLEYTGSPAVRGGFNWGLHFRWDSLPSENASSTEPYASPAMAGGIFAIDRRRFTEIGEYDEAMDIWGGENIELSLRVWMCGGSIKIVPCSRVGHIFRNRRPYGNAGKGDTQLANSVRLAHVWLDEHINKFLDARPEARLITPGDVQKRLNLRENLHCKSFQWYLDNVYPEAVKEPAFTRQDSGSVSRFTRKFRLQHVASGKCLRTDYGKNEMAGLTECDKTQTKKSVMLYEVGENSGKALVLGKKLCLDSDCSAFWDDKSTITKGAVCGTKCHFTGGSQAWTYSQTSLSTLIVNLSRGLCLAFSDGVLRLSRCNESLESLRWRMVSP